MFKNDSTDFNSAGELTGHVHLNVHVHMNFKSSFCPNLLIKLCVNVAKFLWLRDLVS